MIKGIIFDVDGTLLDSMPMWKELDYRFLRSKGKEPEPGYTEIVNKMTLEEGVTYTRKHFNLDMTDDEIIEEIQEMALQFYENEATCKPYVKEFLENLKQEGVPMVVATSSQRDFICPALEHNGILHYFKDVFSCADIGINKQSPEIFLIAAKCLGTDPEETLVVEDSYHAVMTAKSAGFPTLAVYDLSNESCLQDTIKEADLYLPDLRDFARFSASFLKEC